PPTVSAPKPSHSFRDDPDKVLSDSLLKLPCFTVQHLEFLCHRFESLFVVFIAYLLALNHTHIPTRIETPALRLDLSKSRHPANSGDVPILTFRKLLPEH